MTKSRLSLLVLLLFGGILSGCSSDSHSEKSDLSDQESQEKIIESDQLPKIWFPRSDRCGDNAPKEMHSVYSCTFINDQDGWTIARKNDDVNLYVTEDGGQTWIKKETKLPNDTVGISVLDHKKAWLLRWGDDFSLYRTVDGGIHWGEQPIPKPQGFIKRGNMSEEISIRSRNLWFLDEKTAILIVETAVLEAKNQYLYSSHDGGESWSTPQRSDHMSGQKPEGLAGDIYWNFSDPEHLMLIRDETKWVSTDYGSTWTTESH